MIYDRAAIHGYNAAADSDRPQNITPRAPIGSLLKRPAAPPPPRKRVAGLDPDYLAEVRHLPCLSCGMEPCGEAAHVRMASAAYGKSSGMQKTPDDKWAVPLCGDDHRVAKHAQHRQGEAAFWEKLGINPLMVCERLYAVRGDVVAMKAVIIQAISERGTK